MNTNIQIGFQYSNDDGATWSTALEIYCSRFRLWKQIEVEPRVNGVTGRKFDYPVAYYNVELVTAPNDFDPAKVTTAIADANWIALQSWCEAFTRRLYVVNTTYLPKMDGYDILNSSTNTRYFNLIQQGVNFEDQDEYKTNGKKVRYMSLQLQSRERA
jgi:hypothetical protein